MNRRLISFLSALAVLSVLATAAAGGTLAAGSKPHVYRPKPVLYGTGLTVSVAEGAQLGQNITVTAQLYGLGGASLAGQRLHLLVDGIRHGEAITNTQGVAVFVVRHIMNAGNHTLAVEYHGIRTVVPYYVKLLPSQSGQGVSVSPAEVMVQTIPPMPGIKFALNKYVFTSDARGVATIPVQWVGQYHLRLLQPRQMLASGARISFARWQDAVYTTDRMITVPQRQPMQIGFNVENLVHARFLNRFGHLVSPHKVPTVRLLSSTENTYTLHGDQWRWLLASTIVRRETGLSTTSIFYSVLSVPMDGSNAVNQKQQRFLPAPNATWPIHLLLYTVEFKARDAIFGFPVDGKVRVLYPNGQHGLFPTKSGNMVLHSFARGQYTASLTGILGVSATQPVALSRDQVVHISVITLYDIVFVVFLLALGALGFLLWGRPYLLGGFGGVSARRRARSIRAA